MRLDDVTPYILTYNEEANIGRCLESLGWAKNVLVVDSFSDDRTLEIVNSFPNATLIQRVFDSHSQQHNFALSQVRGSRWVLRLDADWVLPPELLSELSTMDLGTTVGGVSIPFDFSIHGEPIAISMYPPVVAFFRRDAAIYEQVGHMDKLMACGDVVKAKRHLIHDDRKSLDRFLVGQINYSKLEAACIDILNSSPPTMKTRLRRIPGIAALLVTLYLLFFRVGLLRGRASIHYVLQRAVAELTISLRALDERIRRENMAAEKTKRNAAMKVVDA